MQTNLNYFQSSNGLAQSTRKIINAGAFLVLSIAALGFVTTTASAETKTPSPRPTSPRSTSDKNYNAVNDFVRSREATTAPSTAPNTVINEQQLKLEMQQNIQQQKLDLNHKLNTTPNSAQ